MSSMESELGKRLECVRKEDKLWYFYIVENRNKNKKQLENHSAGYKTSARNGGL